jgi:hypothetical protein
LSDEVLRFHTAQDLRQKFQDASELNPAAARKLRLSVDRDSMPAARVTIFHGTSLSFPRRSIGRSRQGVFRLPSAARDGGCRPIGAAPFFVPHPDVSSRELRHRALLAVHAFRIILPPAAIGLIHVLNFLLSFKKF